MTLTEKKAHAKAAYKAARVAWMETVTANNIKGDQKAWVSLCDAKQVCRLLGVII